LTVYNPYTTAGNPGGEANSDGGDGGVTRLSVTGLNN